MKERGIIFKAEMVRAILDGRKTMTRRIAKPQHDDGCITGAASEPGHAIEVSGGGQGFRATRQECRPCPYGVAGDRLWVREAWRTRAEWNQIKPSELPCADFDDATSVFIDYPAKHEGNTRLNGKLRPSIFMPRWASRITLEITKVRVERVQEISEEAAKAEGILMPDSSGEAGDSHNKPPDFWSYRQEFGFLWESINGAGAWERNDWVWVLEFKKL